MSIRRERARRIKQGLQNLIVRSEADGKITLQAAAPKHDCPGDRICGKRGSEGKQKRLWLVHSLVVAGKGKNSLYHNHNCMTPFGGYPNFLRRSSSGSVCVAVRAFALLLIISRFAHAAEPPKVTTATLPNGMKLIIEEDHDIPSVAMYLFFKVGSRNERPGITGISHFFEHMMFNGAKKFGPKQFDVQMEKNGGQNNAYTTNDVTVYTDWFPRTALELMLDMESDRMMHLSFDKKSIESERGVVASERQTSVDNSNWGILYEQMNAAAFQAHPYGWPVVGWASDIQAWTEEDLRSHFKMGYAPNNCTLTIVGDVNTAAVLDLAKRYLQAIPRQEPPPPVRTVEPEQRGERRVTVVKAAQLPLALIAYHVPATSHADTPALNMLGTILTDGRSSRLYRRMIDEEQLALAVNFGLDLALDPGLSVISMQVRAEVDPTKAEAVVYEELARAAKSDVSDSELRKAKNQLLANFYRDLKTIAGRANLLGTYETYYGDYRKLYNAPAQIEAVTAADIRRVAAQYFGPNKRTVATLVPEKTAAQ